MRLKELLSKYFIFIIGLYFLSVGIVLIVRSSLGTTPISSVNYVISLNTPLSLGSATFCLNMLLIIGQFWLIRGIGAHKDAIEIMLQIPLSLLFGIFIDANMALTANLPVPNYTASIAVLLAGCIIQAIGIVFELKPNVAIMSAEGFVKYASRRYNRDFGKLKVRFDISLVLAAVVLSLILSGSIQGVREGTAIAAIITGYIVTFLSQHIITGHNMRTVWKFVRNR
jgi:hypothetical protein